MAGGRDYHKRNRKSNKKIKEKGYCRKERGLVILYRRSKIQITRNYTENLERGRFSKKLEKRCNCTNIYKKGDKDKAANYYDMNVPQYCIQNLRNNIRGETGIR